MAPSLSALLKADNVDANEVLKACNASLKQSKSDSDAQHAKVVALLNLDRFDDALRVFDEHGDALQQKARFEHAYALYKTGQLEQAAESVKSLDKRSARHLEAQALYRQENFARAASVYRDLWDSRQEHEESDLRINSGATDAQLEWSRQGSLVLKKKPGREDLEAFETAYNAACGCLARGELSAGEVLLKRAKDLCATSEELSEEDKKGELLPISVQQLYVLSAQGKSEQAEALAEEMLIEDIPEQSTRHIALINKLSVESQPSNPYMSHMLYHSLPTLPNNDRLYDFQSSIAKQDETALDLLCSKFSGVAKSTARFLSAHPSPTTDAVVNGISSENAAAHAQNQLGKLGLKSILPLLKKRPKDVGLVATIVQLYVLTKNHGAAITVMESFFKLLEESETDKDQDVRFAPGLVAILVSLYSAEGRKSHIKTELAKAASYWRRKSKPSPQLLRAAGLSLLNSGSREDLAQAGQLFETLHQQDPKDRFTTAGYVAAYATTQPSKITSEVDKLTAISRLTIGIDAEALEQAGIPQPQAMASKTATRKRPGADVAKPAKKRFRKSKMPEGLDPAKKADPERWLPLRDRSTYRPKGRKGKQKQAALTQGGVNEKAADSGAEAPKTTVVAGGGKPKKKKGRK